MVIEIVGVNQRNQLFAFDVQKKVQFLEIWFDVSLPARNENEMWSITCIELSYENRTLFGE